MKKLIFTALSVGALICNTAMGKAGTAGGPDLKTNARGDIKGPENNATGVAGGPDLALSAQGPQGIG